MHVSNLRRKNVQSNLLLMVYVGSLVFLLIQPSYASSPIVVSARCQNISASILFRHLRRHLSPLQLMQVAWYGLRNRTPATSKVRSCGSIIRRICRARNWGHVGSDSRSQRLRLVDTVSGKGSVSPGGSVAFGGTGRLVRFDPTRNNFTSS